MDPKGFGEILTSKEDMLKRIFIAAGGRAAEIERAGKLGVTGGAKSDFQQMRGLIAQMLSDGMIEDHYVLQPIEMRQEHLNQQQREICDAIFKSAITYARKGLQSIGNEKMGQIVSDALDLDRELVGQEAMDFYRERLSESDIAELENICNQFVNDYLGKSINETGKDPENGQDELLSDGFS
jgi:ATP-dependent Zn protease